MARRLRNETTHGPSLSDGGTGFESEIRRPVVGRGGGEEHMFANPCEGSILCDLCFSGLKFW